MPNPNINRKIVFGGQPPDINYTNDYTTPEWSLNSFNFDATNNIFTGDSNLSTIVNNAIVGLNKQFTINLWVKRLASGATQVLFCRDNSTTLIRQFSCFFSSLNKFIVNFYTTSVNLITYTSTASFTELREWNMFTIVYDGTQGTVTNRVSVYRNGQVEPGTNTQTGVFVSINNTVVNNIELGARSTAANYSNSNISSLSLFNTNLSAANISTLFNNRVPFDIRTNGTLDASLVSYFVATYNSSFSTNWTWTDLKGNGSFVSSGMVVGDLVLDAPALKQVSVAMNEGQSNATGRVTLPGALPAKYFQTLTWCKVWNGTTMTGISATLNNNQYIETGVNQYGVEFYLSNKLNKYFKKTIYYFKVSKGGTSLAYQGDVNNWRYPDGDQGSGGLMYQQLHNTDLPALKEWELANGFTIVKMIDIRSQGEADSGVLADANNYAVNLENFFTRTTTGMHVKILELLYIKPYTYHWKLSANQTHAAMVYKATINTAIDTVVATDSSFRRTIDTDTATVMGDLVHYDDNGYRVLSELTGDLIIADNSL